MTAAAAVAMLVDARVEFARAIIMELDSAAHWWVKCIVADNALASAAREWGAESARAAHAAWSARPFARGKNDPAHPDRYEYICSTCQDPLAACDRCMRAGCVSCWGADGECSHCDGGMVDPREIER